jgi:hypothetical protein
MLILSKIIGMMRHCLFSRCGSIVFESQIIILNTDAEKSRVAGDLQNIRNGDTVTMDGINTKATALTVNGYARNLFFFLLSHSNSILKLENSTYRIVSIE